MIKKKLLLKMTALFSAGLIAAVPLTACKSSAKTGGRQSISVAGMQKRVKTELSALVKNKTITQAQADKIETAFSSMASNGAKRKASSGRQRSSGDYNRSSGNQGSFSRSSPLNKLVQDGTITQAQANAVMQALYPNRGGSGDPQGSLQAS